MKKATTYLLAATLICGMGSTASAEETGASVSTFEDASMYIQEVDNTTIDAVVYLDYSAGIEAGVYKWILSGDGSCYTLAAVDENGEAKTAQESQINIGANNEEHMEMRGVFPGEGKAEGKGPQGGMEMKGRGDGGPGSGGKGGLGGPGGFGSGDTVYEGVYMNANITNKSNQTMLIYVPSAYMETDAEGNVTGINHEAVVGNYTADTAPIVYLNECGGWKSSSPRSVDTSYIEQGMVYVTAGARSRDSVGEDGSHTGKTPTQVVDLKSGVIALRANTDVIPGDTEKIISIGTSGSGQMRSILGATGNMEEYYPYMYEAGALGVTQNEDGTYSSVYADNVYGAQLYCPIADIENADLAYAWWWVDLADQGGTYNGSMTEFERRLQELEADAFVEYINSLNLTDADGNSLTLTGLRSGTYYDAILQNISDALNAAVSAGEVNPASAYVGYDGWLMQNEDGTWSVTDLAGFMTGTGLVNMRNKAIPGFDTMDKSAENDAFGTSEDAAVHYAKSVAQVLSDHYEELSALEGFDKEAVDNYIEETLTGGSAEATDYQTDLMNAARIMLGADGIHAVDPAQYWRSRSGTADQHTSFSIGYNILLAAQSLGLDVDYHLVWDMGHGSNEETTTGTFIDWINEICA